MADQADWTHSFTVRLNCSISGTCSFLDAQFKDMPISAISAPRCSDLLSSRMRVVFKPSCRYIFCTCLIISSILFIVQLLITLPVTNMMCWYMVFRKPMMLMCMRSQNRLNLCHLSRMSLGEIGTIVTGRLAL